MKFQARLNGIIQGLSPVAAAAITGVVNEYADAFKVTVSSKNGELVIESNNGNAAVSVSLTGIAGIDFKPEVDGSVTVKATDLKSVLESYPTDEVVTIEDIGNELFIVPESDPEQKSSMPFDTKTVVMPDPIKSFEKEVQINRDAFIAAMKKVAFAIGDEKFKPQFLYWVLRIRNDGFRTAAGDGSRFIVYEIVGANVVKTQDEFNIHISNNHNAVLQKMLENGTGDNVIIREFGSDPALAQIAVTIDNITVTLIGHDPGVKWPDENKFINRHNTAKYLTTVSDWDLVMKGVEATNNEEARRSAVPHCCVMSFNEKRDSITVQAQTTIKVLRKVAIRDNHFEGEGSLAFDCRSGYIRDMLKIASPGDRVQMEFTNPTKPVVIHFYAGDKITDTPLHKDDATKQTREMFLMFIASSTKHGADGKDGKDGK